MRQMPGSEGMSPDEAAAAAFCLGASSNRQPKASTTKAAAEIATITSEAVA
jgi:hypothetical protein